MKVTTKLKWRRETKGTHFFEVDTVPSSRNPQWSSPVDPNTPVRSIYISKSAFGTERVPQEITITVEG